MREGEIAEEAAGVIAQPLDRLLELRGIRKTGHRARLDESLDVTRIVFEPIVADRESEVLSRDVLELMRLVDNGMATRRNDLAVLVLTNRRIRAEQMMIDDDDVG